MRYIKDEEFLRGETPMTKEEVRILSLSKLDIEPNSVLLDIGAGTGSVSVQMSKLCPEGKVIAIEKEEDALELILKNKEKFHCKNLQLIKGEALEVEKHIDITFDGIFIGGSGGNLEEIIRVYVKKLKSNGKMVFNFISLKNLSTATNTLKALDFKFTISQISVSKVKGEHQMLFANNPIFILEVWI